MAVIVIEDNVWLNIVYSSPQALQRVRFTSKKRLLESAECTEGNVLKLGTTYQKYSKLILKKLSPLYQAILIDESTVKSNISKQDALFWYEMDEEGESLSDAKIRFYQTLSCDDEDMDTMLSVLRTPLEKAIKQVDNSCKSRGLNYWILGGTLNDAIKHGLASATVDPETNEKRMIIKIMGYSITIHLRKNEDN